MKEYDVYWESEYGLKGGVILAKNKKDLIAKLKKEFPEDEGAEGFFTDPDTGKEHWNFW